MKTERPRVSKPAEWTTPEGMRVMLEESHALPIVDFHLALRTGSVHDPKGREGTTRVTWRMVRMGTKSLRGPDVEEAIARLGGRLSIEVSTSYVSIHGAVIRRNLEPFFALVARVVREPSFRAADLTQVRREMLAELVAMRDNDRALAAKSFRRRLFHGHPYGRPVAGTERTLRAIGRQDLAAAHAKSFVAKNIVLGVSGDVLREELESLVDRHFRGLSRSAAPKERIPAPKAKKGRHVVVVDKPDRTQTQVFIGTLGSRAGDPFYYPLVVGNAAFGGTFTSTLMQEVREKRGWSYGAYSRVGTDRQRDAWYMYTFPGAEQVADCISLELDLMERLVDRGVPARDHGFARRYLLGSHCFDVDTAQKRLEPRIDEDIYGMPEGYFSDYEQHVRRVSRDGSNEAIRSCLSAKDLCIVLTATAKSVVPALEKLPGVRSVDVIPHTSV